MLGLGHIQRTFIDGTSGDGADDAWLLCGYQLAQVIQVGHTTGGDDRQTAFAGQSGGRLDVNAIHHAIAGDIGVNDAGDTVIGKALGQFHCLDL